MKLTKPEKIWLICVIVFFFLYNMPFFPAYNHSKATIIHALLTVAPLWFCVYFGLVRICRKFKLKRENITDPQPKQNSADISEKTPNESGKEDASC